MITRGKQLSYEYLAGIVDGEGSIHVRQSPKGTHSIYVLFSVANTYYPLHEALRNSFGGTIREVNANCKVANAKNWKIVYRWELNCSFALPVLKAIEPFLIVKHEQVLLAIEILETLSPGQGNRLNEAQKIRREEILIKCKGLNRRGRAAATTERENTGDSDATV